MTQSKAGHIAVHDRFKQYNRDIKDVWASYNLLSFYLPKVHESVKSGTYPTLHLNSLSGIATAPHVKNKNDTFGTLSHIERKVVPIRTLLSGVSVTEDFLKDLCVLTYERFPQKLSGTDGDESAEQRQKIINTILTSESKEEILSKLTEEKVRGIFYGNVTDFFLKPKKVKLEFGDHFSKEHSINIGYFQEAVARRNVHAHNDGRIDAKYLRETSIFPFKAGQRPILSSKYLQHTLVILRGLSAVAASLVCKNVFNEPSIKGKLGSVLVPFENYYTDSARASGKQFLSP
ncbi:hypothetical protein BLA39750_05029 [Burkholderia lata]|uniref:Uncharacterized protein n=1 Tax=Burkholderia lata (strain ATCC 17760 / DSM 23089 / LMG 22485 / NCIMB 9086 / R18194 / 383) TaxID=482957 RepID=A0A6P2ZNR8_BURL3|nr:hypothetical protein [Burkholderia lata]VWD36234.1 hypothetical protein BLA39750_05029 [Burkholderia lata]